MTRRRRLFLTKSKSHCVTRHFLHWPRYCGLANGLTVTACRVLHGQRFWRPNSVFGLKETFELAYEGGMQNKTWKEMKRKTAEGGSTRIQFGNFITDGNYALEVFQFYHCAVPCVLFP